MSRPALTPKQERFALEYLVDLNATRAAIRAGYSAKTAYSVGHENLKKPEIAAAIEAAKAARAERTQVTADRVVRELARIAFLDPREVMSWGPDGVTFTASSALSEDAARAVAECSERVTEAGGTIRIKLASKLDALRLLGEHLGIWKGPQSNGTDAFGEQVRQIIANARARRAARAARPESGGRGDGEPGQPDRTGASTQPVRGE